MHILKSPLHEHEHARAHAEMLGIVLVVCLAGCVEEREAAEMLFPAPPPLSSFNIFKETQINFYSNSKAVGCCLQFPRGSS